MFRSNYLYREYDLHTDESLNSNYLLYRLGKS